MFTKKGYFISLITFCIPLSTVLEHDTYSKFIGRKKKKLKTLEVEIEKERFKYYSHQQRANN